MCLLVTFAIFLADILPLRILRDPLRRVAILYIYLTKKNKKMGIYFDKCLLK
jgi:hypothetical protein